MNFCDLPQPVILASRALGAFAKERGVRLFVFGSFARGDAQPNSDLDLGFDLPVEGSQSEDVALQLRQQLDLWPTIRPVDLVDFRHVSPEFRRVATRDIIPLNG